MEELNIFRQTARSGQLQSFFLDAIVDGERQTDRKINPWVGCYSLNADGNWYNDCDSSWMVAFSLTTASPDPAFNAYRQGEYRLYKIRGTDPNGSKLAITYEILLKETEDPSAVSLSDDGVNRPY